jgi:flavorubredoxin
MSMHNAELAKGIYQVGAVDWTVRDFHGYNTPRGVTYNSYLIVDEKVCLIDAVKAPFAKELIERVREIIDPAKIDYVIVNHVEPDHSSGLPAFMEVAPQAKVILTEQGRGELIKYFGREYDFRVVKNGDTLSLGKHTLRFVPLPMLHWPDSMATYLEEEQILFSNDAFGQHYSSNFKFDDENELSEVNYEAKKYYANILMPFSKLVLRALDTLATLPIRVIAPSHGVIWRSNVPEIVALYKKWGAGETEPLVLVVYETMWGSTEAMARKILEGLTAEGIKAKLYRLAESDRSEIVAELLLARGLIIGASTQNNGMLSEMAGLLYHLKGLKPLNKAGAAFGAYGWAGGAQADIETALKAAGITVKLTGPTLKWAPTPEELQRCFEFGRDFAHDMLGQ